MKLDLHDQVDHKEIRVLVRELERAVANNLSAAVIELGCYTGGSAVAIARSLRSLKHSGEFHVYDSFQGLPAKSAQDESPAGLQFQSGQLLATKKQLMHSFLQNNLKLPLIHKGWFEDLGEDQVPNGISFAFLDGDYYSSIRSSLRLIESKLIPGGRIVVDDYSNEALPGARRAVDKWVAIKQYPLRVEASLAIITVT